MKPRTLSGQLNPIIWTKIDGRLVGERWVPCPDFARAIRRPYATVLDMMRKGLIPAMEFGNAKRWICLTPLKRAKAAYRALLKAGRTWQIKA